MMRFAQRRPCSAAPLVALRSSDAGGFDAHDLSSDSDDEFVDELLEPHIKVLLDSRPRSAADVANEIRALGISSKNDLRLEASIESVLLQMARRGQVRETHGEYALP